MKAWYQKRNFHPPHPKTVPTALHFYKNNVKYVVYKWLLMIIWTSSLHVYLWNCIKSFFSTIACTVWFVVVFSVSTYKNEICSALSVEYNMILLTYSFSKSLVICNLNQFDVSSFLESCPKWSQIFKYYLHL